MNNKELIRKAILLLLFRLKMTMYSLYNLKHHIIKRKIRKCSFYPIHNLDDKSNYKLYSIIEKNGSILNRVFLDVPDASLREELICIHYLKNQFANYYKKPIKYRIISRDRPWDFKILFNTKESFNIEITSIADDVGTFERFKREERFKIKWFEKKIPLHELEKLNNFFPSPNIESLIRTHNDSNISKLNLVDNPFYNMPHLITSCINKKSTPLQDLIKEVVDKKEAKKHSEKNITVLIIDNRTMLYEISDLHSAIESLSVYLNSCSFKEIWFYTGYHSSSDGQIAEYSLVALKLGIAKKKILEQKLKKHTPDKNGIIYIDV